ncbi:hypothetical protein C9993_07825 [Marinobacter sp. Z-F4-2]|nr:hypothetical protein C9993_07825 [Marinobacter sp. Z-F4-2]
MFNKLGMYLKVNTFLCQQGLKKIIHFKLKVPLSKALVLIGLIFRRVGKSKAGLELILKGRRVAQVKKADDLIFEMVKRNSDNFESLLPFAPDFDVEMISRRILILKLPELSDGLIKEKGAIIIKFSESFSIIYKNFDVNSLSKYFNIILEPSSVGYSLPEILVWNKLSPAKVFVMAPYRDDFNFIKGIQANLIPLTLGPSDWVNTERFFKINGKEKNYDAIYIANFNPIKRVERYIKAVSRIQKVRPNFKAALILADHGDKKDEILKYIEYFERKVKIDYFGAMSQVQLNEILNSAKANLLISLREGSNKGLAEGLFSGTPGILIAENAGGNHAHMNEFTGKIVKDGDLEKAMIWLSENYESLSPEVWAKENMSAEISAANLSQVIKGFELEEGREWNTDLKAKINSPELSYFDSRDDWLLSKRRELLEIFSRSDTKIGVSDKMNNFLINK